MERLRVLLAAGLWVCTGLAGCAAQPPSGVTSSINSQMTRHATFRLEPVLRADAVSGENDVRFGARLRDLIAAHEVGAGDSSALTLRYRFLQSDLAPAAQSLLGSNSAYQFNRPHNKSLAVEITLIDAEQRQVAHRVVGVTLAQDAPEAAVDAALTQLARKAADYAAAMTR